MMFPRPRAGPPTSNGRLEQKERGVSTGNNSEVMPPLLHSGEAPRLGAGSDYSRLLSRPLPVRFLPKRMCRRVVAPVFGSDDAKGVAFPGAGAPGSLLFKVASGLEAASSLVRCRRRRFLRRAFPGLSSSSLSDGATPTD